MIRNPIIIDPSIKNGYVPGYDKEQYIDPEILKNVKGGSYACCDEEGNYYRSGFGLHY